MTFTPEQLTALLPLLLTSATAVLVMLAISIKRHHWWNATFTVIGLNLALLSILVVLPTIPQIVTPLLVVYAYACF